ncbi:Ser/Thr protein phosphatase, putative [Trichomonas vaginalis G3]|uniref:Serine/threonine-protein phosphatase n=1 Tax=Trichomonas vaginalis (strain ATCC PRA-98 / G3) TaxID=412133 RepID=A2DV85_TRIV3|nr:phosphoprotein phosphatase protein [Trichomonas vaginalis G3]EAY15681.1 Ser/Thr protein phosphatase, putative [Trichomonas vaginalis G3]KAI5504531.1 phosphoprotein phosphatase protein [Trichomonas vaginalis G3]|eukprot:XP_001327904.1 Ser/Thr protein phosphatase [Trichomonas vaginalis G3]
MKSVDLIYSSFKQLFGVEVSEMTTVGDTIPIPKFQESTLKDLINEALKTYSKPTPVVNINDNVVIVGDLHGNLHDLLRIIKKCGQPNTQKYVFLGDYVDRGQYSLEVIVLLLTFRVLYPNSVTLLRGNHEVAEINVKYGFHLNVASMYGQSILWDLFNDVFALFPFVAIVQKDIFCVHGGISQHAKFLIDIKSIQVPTLESCDIVNDLLWSDPVDSEEKFAPNNRGLRCQFNAEATKEFLQLNNFSCIIRGHQCVFNGIECKHGDDVITVFSSSNYSDYKNKCGYLILNDKICYEAFYPADFVKRQDAVFFDVIPCGTFDIRRNSISNISVNSWRFPKIRSGHSVIKEKTRPIHVTPTIPILQNTI